MAGDESPHLRVTFDDVAERAPVGRRQADLVPRRDAGRDGRMVQRDERKSIRSASQLGIEPAQPFRVQLAPILSRSRAVQHHKPQRPEIRRVLHRRPHGSGKVEVPSSWFPGRT